MKTFEKLIGESIKAYIDDMATYSDSFEDHLVHLWATFEAAKKTGIRLKASKCHFCYPEIKFVGYLVSLSGIWMMPEKVKKVQEWLVPRDRRGSWAWLATIVNLSRISQRSWSLSTRW